MHQILDIPISNGLGGYKVKIFKDEQEIVYTLNYIIIHE